MIDRDSLRDEAIRSSNTNRLLLVSILTKTIEDRQTGFSSLLLCSYRVRVETRAILLRASISFHLKLAYHLNKSMYAAAQFPIVPRNKILDREKSDAKLEAAFVTSSQTP